MIQRAQLLTAAMNSKSGVGRHSEKIEIPAFSCVELEIWIVPFCHIFAINWLRAPDVLSFQSSYATDFKYAVDRINPLKREIIWSIKTSTKTS